MNGQAIMIGFYIGMTIAFVTIPWMILKNHLNSSAD